MCVLDPPYIRRPTSRFAYCTVTRRWPRSMKMIAPTTTTIITSSSSRRMSPICPVRSWSNVVITARGRPLTIPAKMMSDIPLPMPRSVICSPSHMMNAVPVVSVSTVIRRKPHPPWYTSGRPPATFVWRSRKIAMLSACTTARKIVP